MLLAPYAPVQVFLMTLMIQARHLFYGISMLDKFKGMGWKKPYLIFDICDETFSINYTADIPEHIDRSWFYFFVTLLNHFYWFSGATIGGLVGCLLLFGADNFLIPTMVCILIVLTALKKPLKQERGMSEV